MNPQSLITPQYLRELLAPAKAGQSMTHEGPHQTKAMISRNKFQGLRVMLNGFQYDVLPGEGVMFRLFPIVSGLIGNCPLSWGYMAFNAALKSGQIEILTQEPI
jgi:hypothetical protein